MTHLVSFRTSKFDVRAEKPNPINPLAGQGVLNWLRGEVAKANYAATEPDAEDWGWYVDVQGNGASYLVGASADAESVTPHIDWIVQGHKHPSFQVKILRHTNLLVNHPPLPPLTRFS